MSSKSKSGLSETPSSKASPAAPRVSKLSRSVAKADPGSPSPMQKSRPSVDLSPKSTSSVHSRLSLDTQSPKSVNSVHSRMTLDTRSPKSVNSKPTIDRRSPRVATPPEKKPPTRALKESELQAQLNVALEDLRKAKEQLSLVEEEKVRAVNELKEAQKTTDEAHERYKEALAAQKRAEESLEIEKFRAIELEQAGIEAAQKKEDEWKNEVESVKSQHSSDMAALLSATEELQRVKLELALTSDAKSRVMSHADDATKIAEIHAEKVELLSAEIVQLKATLDSKRDMEVSERNAMVMNLNLEIDSLKQELEKARSFHEDMMEKDDAIEKLNVELEAARMAESYACNLVAKWKERVEDLEKEVAEASQLEKVASESLKSITGQLQSKNDTLRDAEAEIVSLKEKAGLLEMSIGRQKGSVVESERRLSAAKEEALAMAKMVESLQSELETVKEDRTQALHNEKLAASSIEKLLKEKNELMDELANSRAEEEKSKWAMESLASALHEVSAEGREIKEKLISSVAANEDYRNQLEDLKIALNTTNDKYEATLDDARYETGLLTNTIERIKSELKSSKAKWEQEELDLVSCVKKSEEEASSLGKEVSRLVSLVEETQTEASAAKNSFKAAESEVMFLKEALGEAEAESVKRKEMLLDKENELQSVTEENKELRTREAGSIHKIEELSKLLEEASAKKQSEEAGELSEGEKDYDLLPKVVEFSEENWHGSDETPKQGEEPRIKDEESDLLEAVQNDAGRSVQVNGKTGEDEGKLKVDESNESGEVDFKMWDSCRIGEKDFLPEGGLERGSFEEELGTKDNTNVLECTDNGGISPTRLSQQKKKKPLLRKFGSLLKRKGNSNP